MEFSLNFMTNNKYTNLDIKI